MIHNVEKWITLSLYFSFENRVRDNNLGTFPLKEINKALHYGYQ